MGLSNTINIIRVVNIVRTVLLIVLLMVLLFFIISCSNGSAIECNKIDSIPATITVKSGPLSVIGLNADTDSLKFGAVSPSASAKRSVIVEYSKPAKVKVFMEGNLSAWTAIEPNEFSLTNLELKESRKVDFTVKAPAETKDGNYTGEAIFCYQEE